MRPTSSSLSCPPSIPRPLSSSGCTPPGLDNTLYLLPSKTAMLQICRAHSPKKNSRGMNVVHDFSCMSPRSFSNHLRQKKCVEQSLCHGAPRSQQGRFLSFFKESHLTSSQLAKEALKAEKVSHLSYRLLSFDE